MDNNVLGDVGETLRAEEARLQTELKKCKAKVGEIEGGLKRVQLALEALTGDKWNSKRGAPKKPAASKADVLASIAVVQNKSGTLQRDELEKLVKADLKANGKSLTGFALRFRESIVSPDEKGDS